MGDGARVHAAGNNRSGNNRSKKSQRFGISVNPVYTLDARARFT
jgi:hypothetical protein